MLFDPFFYLREQQTLFAEAAGVAVACGAWGALPLISLYARVVLAAVPRR